MYRFSEMVSPVIQIVYAAAVPEPFGNLLARLIAERKWHVQEVAARTRFSRSTIYRHLDGRTIPRPHDREKYAEAFGMPVEDLDAMWSRPQVVGHSLGSIFAVQLDRLWRSIEEVEQKLSPAESAPYLVEMQKLKASLAILRERLDNPPAVLRGGEELPSSEATESPGLENTRPTDTETISELGAGVRRVVEEGVERLAQSDVPKKRRKRSRRGPGRKS